MNIPFSISSVITFYHFETNIILTCSMTAWNVAKMVEWLLGVPKINIAATVTFS